MEDKAQNQPQEKLGLYVSILAILGFLLGLPTIIKAFVDTPDIKIGSFIIGRNAINICILLAVFFVLCIMLIWFVLFKRRQREAYKVTAVAASNNIALTSILIEDCKKIVRSGEIDKIISKHTKRITNHINELQISVRNQIETVIDEDFLDASLEALRNNSNKARFEPVLNKAYNEIAGLSSLENFIKEEYRETLTEIKTFVLRWLKDEDITQYLEVSKSVQEQMSEIRKRSGGKFFFFLNPQLKDIITLNYEQEVMLAAALIPAFKIIASKTYTTLGIATVASLGGVLASFGVDDFDITHDFGIDTIADSVQDEIGHNVASELFEYVGAAIPYIGFAFVILRFIRYAGIFKLFIDKPKKLREMREKIAYQISQFLDSILEKSTFEIEHSSFELVSILQQKFAEIQNTAISQLKKAKKYI